MRLRRSLLRALPLPAARAAAARRTLCWLRVRRRLPPTFEGERAAREGAENGRGASRRALRDSGGVAPRLALVGCVLCLSVVSESAQVQVRYSWRTVICRSARGRLFLFTFLVVARATTDEHEVSCLAEARTEGSSPLSVLPPGRSKLLMGATYEPRVLEGGWQ